MHYLVYQIQHKDSGKLYIGCHQTIDPDDGYLGSGTVLKRAIAKHGIDAFTKTILHDFDSPEAMFAKEAELVNEEFVSRKDTYNIKVGGFGGWDYVNASHGKINQRGSYDPILATLGPTKLKKLWNDPNWRASQIQKFQKAQQKRVKEIPSHWIGKSHTPETIAKQKLAHKGQSKGSKNPLFGKKWMTDGTNSKPATKEEQEILLASGWKYGRILLH